MVLSASAERPVGAAAELVDAELVEAIIVCRVRLSCVELVFAFLGLLEENGWIVV